MHFPSSTPTPLQRSIGIGADKELKERVQGAIARVFDMQDSLRCLRQLGTWQHRPLAHELRHGLPDACPRSRLRRAPASFNQALDRLQNFALNGEDFQDGGEDRAYALYVLARNGRAPIGELRYYADTRSTASRRRSPRLSSVPRSPWSATRSAPRRAFKARARCLRPSRTSIALPARDYGSDMRDGAALVTLAYETGIVKSETPRLVNVVAKAYLGRNYTSTQEQAWMLLAAHALGDQAKRLEARRSAARRSMGSVVRSLSAGRSRKGLDHHPTTATNADRRGRLA